MSSFIQEFVDGNVILGSKIAKSLRLKIKDGVKSWPEKPKLMVILVGNNPASQIYVKNKHKFAEECGFEGSTQILPKDTLESTLLAHIYVLNHDENVHGILVQMPLPPHIDAAKIIAAIDPKKDVDGFHIQNMGKLLTNTTNENTLLPCTPMGCVYMLKNLVPSLKGLNVAIIGSSNIVGKPLAAMLMNEGATVSVLNSKTKDRRFFTKNADVVITACGVPNVLRGDDVKEGVIILDVGINRLPDGKVVGDCNFEECKMKAKFITPVPGGIGPMTIAMLLQNTVKAYKAAVL
jgi:methylenetetrahydrofolate dehydrogenase (NADP+)/methenyltetrahydrofolate cyclohydrolase